MKALAALDQLAALGASLHPCYLLTGTLLDGDLAEPVFQAPVDTRGRQRHVKGHVIVHRRQRFQIRPDLVRHVARISRAVRSRNHDVDLPAVYLHTEVTLRYGHEFQCHS